MHGESERFPFVPVELEPLCVPLESIKLWKDNPRINEGAAEELAESIRANLFRDPIEIDQHGIARAGNTRWKAARLLGMTHAPAIRTSFASEAAAAAYGIANNREGERAEWDPRVLVKLASAPEFAAHRAATGFSENEFAKLAERLVPPEEFAKVDPDAPTRHSCPRCGYEFN